MPVFVAFLRAVNVGKRKYPMAELRALLEEAGFGGVETYIQTGNVRLESSRRSVTRLSEELEELFEVDRGFEVPTVVLTPKELSEIGADAVEVAREHQPSSGQYVELLRTAPTADGIQTIEEQRHPGQRAVVRGRAVHLLFDIPFGQAKPPNAAVKRAMGVSTNRNVKVIRQLGEKWGA
jgi:uncharacterized protein (DUF1697 family)